MLPFLLMLYFFFLGLQIPSETAASLLALKDTFKTEIHTAFNFKGWLNSRKEYFKKGKE